MNAEFDELLSTSISILDRPLTVTWFKGRRDIGKDERTASIRQLAEQIRSVRAETKDKLPAIKLARFGSARTYGDTGALRNDSNVIAVTGVEIDHDSGTITVEEAEQRITAAGLAGLLVTTASHSRDKHHWRAFFPLSADVEGGRRAALVARLNGIFGGELDQHASFTLSQLQYVGAVDGGHPVSATLMDGRALDLATDLDSGALDKGKRHDGRNAATDEAGLLAAIAAGESYHPASTSLVGKWCNQGMSEESAVERLRSAMEQVATSNRDRRWRDRFKAVPALVRDIYKRDAKKADAWADGLDTFADNDDFDSLLSTAAAASDDDFASFEVDPGAPRKSRDPDVERLNLKHAVVAHHGRTLITTLEDDGSIGFGTMHDLNVRYANDRRTIPAGKGNKAAEKSEPVSAYWVRHKDRATYDRLTFEPGVSRKNTLNLWRGWNVEPNPAASCARFLEHVRDVICRGNPDHAAYVFGWMAHLVQRPAEKPGVALVLRGGKGAGKDTVAEYLAAMIGRRHVPTVSHENHITGNFNKRLEAALLLHVQEGSWAGDRRAEGVLKYLVTSEFVEIERKGIDSFQLPSFLRLFISSNADWTVPASADERRWAVFNVSDARCGDGEYFGRLRTEMNGSGPAALLAWLQTYDLSGFNVRKAPDTAGLLDQKLASLRNVEAWWHEILAAGEMPGSMYDAADWQEEGKRVLCDEMRRAYADWMRTRRFDGETLSDQHFGRRLLGICPAIARARPNTPGRPRQYVIPDLETCRALFAEWIGGRVDWT